MDELRDAPYIRDAGWEDDYEAVCPVCGSRADTYYANKSGAYIGCDECLIKMDSLEFSIRYGK